MNEQYSSLSMASNNAQIKETLSYQFCTSNLDKSIVFTNRDSRAEEWHGEKKPRARFDESFGKPPHSEY